MGRKLACGLLACAGFVLMVCAVAGTIAWMGSLRANQTEGARLELQISETRVRVGQTARVRLTLRNTGSIGLGLPQYRLQVADATDGAMLDPASPEPIVHSLMVQPGGEDWAEFSLLAMAPGEATVRGWVSYEVHLGYPGPAYWGSASSGQVQVRVVGEQ